MLKRFGDKPMTRRAILQAHGKATAEGLTPETYEKHLAAEFAKWIGNEPDGDPSQELGQAAEAVAPSPEPGPNPDVVVPARPIPTVYPAPVPARPIPTVYPAPTQPQQSPAPLQVTPPPFPKTTAALTAALGAFSFSSNPGDQGNSTSWGAGVPHLQPKWPNQAGTTVTTPGNQPSPSDPSPQDLTNQPQAQENWRLIGQIIAEEIRKVLETLFKSQYQQATQQATNANPVPNEPTGGGVSLPRILNRLAGKLPKPLQGIGKKAVRAFGKTRFGKAARRGVASLGKTKAGRGISKFLGSKILGGGGGSTAGGAGRANVLVAIAQTMKDTIHQATTPQGHPSGGYADRTASAMGLGSLIKFAKTLDNATERLAGWNLQMGTFSATMNRIAMEREIQEMGRSREMGDRLAGSAQALVYYEQQRKDAEKEYIALAGSLENLIMAGMNNIQASFLNTFSGIAKKANEVIGNAQKLNEEKTDLGSLIDRTAEYDRKMTEDALQKMRRLGRRIPGD